MLRNADLDEAVADATARYIAANPQSAARHHKARGQPAGRQHPVGAVVRAVSGGAGRRRGRAV